MLAIRSGACRAERRTTTDPLSPGYQGACRGPSSSVAPCRPWSTREVAAKTDAAAGRAATSFSGQGAETPRGKATLASRLTDPFTEPPRGGREGVT
jgi:hypothetical protein